MSQNGHHDIYIMKVGNQYRVRPAVWSGIGKPGKGPKIRNLTNENVQLLFPPALTPTDTWTPVDLGPKRQGNSPASNDQTSVNLKELQDADEPIVSQYLVIVLTATGSEYASGESEPTIIIDPPPA